MNSIRIVSHYFPLIIILIGNMQASQKGASFEQNPALKLPISSLNGVQYGRIIATHAAGNYLTNRDVNGWGIIAGQAGASALSRTTSAILVQKDKNQDVNYAFQTKQTALHFGVDGLLRVMEAYAAYYGLSSKNIVKKSKEYLPEVVADGVEVLAPIAGEILHAAVSESLTNSVVHKTGCDK